MSERKITCTNNDGDSMTFTETTLSPFLLYSVEGVYDLKTNMIFSENTMTDGATYLGSTAKYRNIVLTLEDTEIDTPFSENREMLNKLFKRGVTGTLLFEEDDNKRAIEYYVEDMHSDGTHTKRLHTVSLICPDPFFYDPEETEVTFAEWISAFEFLHEFTASCEELGYYTAAYKDIYNASADENIGLTIIITGSADVVNPGIVRFESDESIQVGSELHPFTLLQGDTLTITTHTGNKHIYLTHDGVTTEVNQYMTEDSVFIQLMRGDNNIGFLATSGGASMVVKMIYRIRYVRA